MKNAFVISIVANNNNADLKAFAKKAKGIVKLGKDAQIVIMSVMEQDTDDFAAALENAAKDLKKPYGSFGASEEDALKDASLVICLGQVNKAVAECAAHKDVIRLDGSKWTKVTVDESVNVKAEADSKKEEVKMKNVQNENAAVVVKYGSFAANKNVNHSELLSVAGKAPQGFEDVNTFVALKEDYKLSVALRNKEITPEQYMAKAAELLNKKNFAALSRVLNGKTLVGYHSNGAKADWLTAVADWFRANGAKAEEVKFHGCYVPEEPFAAAAPAPKAMPVEEVVVAAPVIVEEEAAVQPQEVKAASAVEALKAAKAKVASLEAQLAEAKAAIPALEEAVRKEAAVEALKAKFRQELDAEEARLKEEYAAKIAAARKASIEAFNAEMAALTGEAVATIEVVAKVEGTEAVVAQVVEQTSEEETVATAAAADFTWYGHKYQVIDAAFLAEVESLKGKAKTAAVHDALKKGSIRKIAA